MTISKSRVDREFSKFVEVAGETAVRVSLVGGAGGGGITQAEAQAAFEAALIAQQQNLPNLTEAQVEAAVSSALNAGATLANLQTSFENALVSIVQADLQAIKANTLDLDANTDQLESLLTDIKNNTAGGGSVGYFEYADYTADTNGSTNTYDTKDYRMLIVKVKSNLGGSADIQLYSDGHPILAYEIDGVQNPVNILTNGMQKVVFVKTEDVSILVLNVSGSGSIIEVTGFKIPVGSDYLYDFWREMRNILLQNLLPPSENVEYYSRPDRLIYHKTIVSAPDTFFFYCKVDDQSVWLVKKITDNGGGNEDMSYATAQNNAYTSMNDAITNYTSLVFDIMPNVSGALF